MFETYFDTLLRPYAKAWLQPDAIKRHGMRNLMNWAKLYNRWRYGKRARAHQRAFQLERDELLRENGSDPAKLPRLRVQDGWAIDTSGTLPHLDEFLREMEQIVRKRGGSTHSDIQQPFLRNLMVPDDVAKYPSMLNFITSIEILAITMDYLQTVPVLSKSRPPGLRFMESNYQLDPGADGPWRESQLYHLDLHDTPLLYVLVAVEDITVTSGPWHFLPASTSERATKMLGYREKGTAYRVTDEQMQSVLGDEQPVVFAYPKGTVLFIDSSRCFHFGSRRAWPPRFQFMYAYTSAVRGDFSQTFMESPRYPLEAATSRLRRMVLE